MMRNGDNLDHRAPIPIDDTEREAVEKIAAKSAMKRRPTLRAFDDALNRDV